VARARISERRVFGALLLATTLLFCHGLFGASHVLARDGASQPATKPAVQEQVAAHGASAGHDLAGHAQSGPASGGVEAPGHHAGFAADYFAVLLVLVGAAALGVLRLVVRAPVRGEIPRVFGPRRRFAGGLPLPRGPSPPLSQVFRL
jgi:hypothetical protein